MPDKIFLRGMEFYGFHGLNREENSYGQKFIVSVEIERDLQAAGTTDDLADTLDYAACYQEIAKVVEGSRFYLLETLAERVAAACLRYPQARAVTVEVVKPQAPLPGKLEAVGVTIYRTAAPPRGGNS